MRINLHFVEYLQVRKSGNISDRFLGVGRPRGPRESEKKKK